MRPVWKLLTYLNRIHLNSCTTAASENDTDHVMGKMTDCLTLGLHRHLLLPPRHRAALFLGMTRFTDTTAWLHRGPQEGSRSAPVPPCCFLRKANKKICNVASRRMRNTPGFSLPIQVPSAAFRFAFPARHYPFGQSDLYLSFSVWLGFVCFLF